MQAARTLVLQHLRLRARPSVAAATHGGGGRAALAHCGFARGMNAPVSQEGGGGCEPDSESAVRARVVDLVKKFDKIDSEKVGSWLSAALICLFISFFFLYGMEIMLLDLCNV
jgi:NADH dehydrogenase (ubiquinone) 1 alpha/beta subcomplex 1, acyl-carrier protein